MDKGRRRSPKQYVSGNGGLLVQDLDIDEPLRRRCASRGEACPGNDAEDLNFGGTSSSM